MDDNELTCIEPKTSMSTQNSEVSDNWSTNVASSRPNGCALETLTDVTESTGFAPEDGGICRKKGVRRVTFGKVEIYYFERSQGFVCVPSQGGSTLGMRPFHSAFEVLTVSDHQDLRLLERYVAILRKHATGKVSLTTEQLRFMKEKIDSSHFMHLRDAFYKNPVFHNMAGSESISPTPTESCIASYHCRTVGSSGQTDGVPSSHDYSAIRNADVESQLSGLIDCYFLQLIPVKKRRILLRKSGVKNVDHTERIECQAIRMSREVCGCSCPNGVCSPLSCPCALDGIRCQVDRALFPCSCLEHSYCRNPEGRIEFDSARVRTHYLHTRMRLEMENSHNVFPVPISENSATPLASDVVGSEQPPMKKARYESSSSVSGSPHLLESEERVHGLLLSDSTESDSFLSKFNTTRYGACLDCENDKFLHGLADDVGISRGCEEGTSSDNLYLTSNPEVLSIPTNSSHPYGTFWELSAPLSTDPNGDSLGTNANTSEPGQEYDPLCSALISDVSATFCDEVADHPSRSSVCQVPPPLYSSGQYESHCPSEKAIPLPGSEGVLITLEPQSPSSFNAVESPVSCTGSNQPCWEQQRGLLEPISSLFSHRISSDVAPGAIEELSSSTYITDFDSVDVSEVQVVTTDSTQTAVDPIFHYASLHNPETGTSVGNAPSTESSSRATSPYVETVSA